MLFPRTFACMTLQQWWLDARKQLNGIYEEREASNILQWLLEDSLKLNKSTYQLRLPKPLADDEQLLLNKQLARLTQGEPLQYITEVADFYGLKFRVSPEVLIPRPETEELVALVLHSVPKEGKLTILDVGTGSGCIPISLKLARPNWAVHTVDISGSALAVAKWNATVLGASVGFAQNDFLNESTWSQLALPDVLISNPPYIAEDELAKMTNQVLLHEPRIALIPDGDDTLIFYKKLAAYAGIYKPKHVFLELNPRFAFETAHFFQSVGYVINLVQDMQGKDRMLHAQLQ
jgi:release factor glutamine methyltransferase